jgi:hypothetical protein
MTKRSVFKILRIDEDVFLLCENDGYLETVSQHKVINES